ncbi:hypothetical protein [Haliangium ochraceum]|uniref:Lipoprotein n=1 Tax=Haliangium ochraceum (strain DSM 14365 / JCM 11303 / SMP-2) TaxID=502025 RepID=D0LVB9_HALO1|nr:hypothetical protein [Haliangium ochraceum]ACY17480.1 hypothetical protein Hoch_4991 [Haliangium ochraceum DSM 14365]
MKLRLWSIAACALLALGACKKEPEAPPPLPEVAPASVPVLATLEMPSGRSLGTAGRLLDEVAPGTALEVESGLPEALAGALGLSSLDGADLDAPVRAVVLDPKAHPQPVVLLVRVADADTLAATVGQGKSGDNEDEDEDTDKAEGQNQLALERRGELALIGAGEAVATAHDFAFGTLAARPAPAAPHAIAYLGPALDSFRSDIDAAKSQIGMLLALSAGGDSAAQMAVAIQAYFDLMLATLEQGERIELRVAESGQSSGLELSLHARADTTLAGFVAAQAASDFALLSSLPALEQATLYMAGSMALGPADEGALELAKTVMSGLLGAAIGDQLADTFEPWMALFSGRVAMVASVRETGSQMVQVAEVSDAEQAIAFSRRFFEALASQGQRFTVAGVEQKLSLEPEAFVHEGVPVMMHRTEVLAAEDPEVEALAQQGALADESYMAGVDGKLAMATGDADAMRGLIDTIAGRAPALKPDGLLGQALAISRARRDSALILMNLQGLGELDAPAGALLSMGFGDGAVRLLLAPMR